MNLKNRPPKTKVDWTNEDEMRRFKERRRFESWRDKGHFYFDKIWHEAKLMNRRECYNWLADKLGLTEDNAHFSKLSQPQCKDAIFYCQQLLNDNRRFDLDFGANPITPLYVLEH